MKLLYILLFLFSPAILFAQEAMPELASAPAVITSFVSSVDPMILAFIVKYPLLVKILLFVGAARSFLKPIMSLYWTYVSSTEDKKDDLQFKKISGNKFFGMFAFLLDYAASFKVKNPKV